ncbi:hypothetical protein MOVS_08875 [Moraxella ovis]|uniref:Uncharacterized protein n=1 Tax=Moraxella ovis TaxID=29433 RepID=A0A378PN57_9GAMM|nr:hypothetical protein [Moraxella ovis]ANB92065.1 hypothetical protein MOVS_08875 [Moraxella ovis]STY87826.1 Uncharacterised protein [Moraxella ovis]
MRKPLALAVLLRLGLASTAHSAPILQVNGDYSIAQRNHAKHGLKLMSKLLKTTLHAFSNSLATRARFAPS